MLSIKTTAKLFKSLHNVFYIFKYKIWNHQVCGNVSMWRINEWFYIHDLERSSVDTGAAPFGTTTGAAAFSPLWQYSKTDAQSPRSDVKGIISLSDVSRMQSPAIFPKEGEITSLCRQLASRWTDIFTEYQTLIIIPTCKIVKILKDQKEKVRATEWMEWLWRC